MKYGSQLKGWAVDRVIELAKLGSDVLTTKDNVVESLISQAQILADFCYNASEDAADIDSRIKELKEDLEYLQAIQAKPASNALDNQEGNA